MKRTKEAKVEVQFVDSKPKSIKESDLDLWGPSSRLKVKAYVLDLIAFEISIGAKSSHCMPPPIFCGHYLFEILFHRCFDHLACQ